MTDVWRSVGRKYCEICKCWFYNNKISWERHEQGNRHKGNVVKKLREIGQQRREQQATAREEQAMLLQMEMGGRAAYKADLKAAGSSSQTKVEHLKTYGSSSYSRGSYGGGLPGPSLPAARQSDSEFAIWFEAVTPEGRVYYWNCVTQKSQWKPPKAGYVTISAQLQQASARLGDKSQQLTAPLPKPVQPAGPLPNPELVGPPPPPLPPATGGMRQPAAPPAVACASVVEEKPPPLAGHPYGPWRPVIEAPKSESIKMEPPDVAVVEVHEDAITFEEKKLKSASGSGASVAFKKRKLLSTSQRKRTDLT